MNVFLSCLFGFFYIFSRDFPYICCILFDNDIADFGDKRQGFAHGVCRVSLTYRTGILKWK